MRRVFRLWQSSGSDLRTLRAALRSSRRPRWLLPALLALAFFALDPLNLALLPVGLIDDLVLLPLLLRVLARLAAAARSMCRESSLGSFHAWCAQEQPHHTGGRAAVVASFNVVTIQPTKVATRRG